MIDKDEYKLYKEYRFTPQGVCSQQIRIWIDGDNINNVAFYGGCNGNLKAIAKLVADKPIEEIASILEGNTCGYRNTSCADQFARALRQIQKENA